MYFLQIWMYICFCFITPGHLYQRPARPTPVVFIPGNGGSRLEARVERPELTHPSCDVRHGWFTLWMDVWQFILGKMDCWAENTKLHFNTTTNTSHNAPWLEVRVPGWGQTSTVEYLDNSWTAWMFKNVGAYAAPLFDKMSTWGYTRNIDLRGAPYDFRYAPHALPHYFRDLKSLIEETYAMNGNSKVILMSHSMGGLYTMYFLNKQSQQWKDTYIHSFLSLATPWYGTVILNQVMVSGYVWGINIIDPWNMRTVQRSQGSAPLLLPSPHVWHQDEIIIRTPEKNYTVMNYEEFFDDIEYPSAKHMLRDITNEDYQIRHPGVKLICIYSSGLPTPERLIYRHGLKDTRWPSLTVNGDGDGTVNLRSLEGCQSFMNLEQESEGEIDEVYVLDKAAHNDMFTDPDLWRILQNFLFS